MSESKHNKIVSIVGARPQFIKLAPSLNTVDIEKEGVSNDKG